ncbi:MAG TPA: hypothetical protein VF801_16805 [Rhodocyclaceae bacterium]
MTKAIPGERRAAARLLRGWKILLFSARHRRGFPLIVAFLAVLSSGTGLYPFMPVLVAAVAMAPSRWRAIYLAAVAGSAAGAGLLAVVVQAVGRDLAGSFPAPGTLPRWLQAEQLLRDYGDYAMAIVAGLPVPQLPVLVALALAGTPPWTVALAVLAGKAVKYGAYVMGTELVVTAFRRLRQRLAPR